MSSVCTTSCLEDPLNCRLSSRMAFRTFCEAKCGSSWPRSTWILSSCRPIACCWRRYSLSSLMHRETRSFAGIAVRASHTARYPSHIPSARLLQRVKRRRARSSLQDQQGLLAVRRGSQLLSGVVVPCCSTIASCKLRMNT